MKQNLFLVAIFCCFLVACNKPQPISTPYPTNTPYPTYTPFPTSLPPTYTPYPTYTPFPTDTPFPTHTPIPVDTPTPTPDPRLFWDDFEMGIKSEWGMSGNNYTSVNGSLTVEDGFLESRIIGDSNWHNYIVKLDNVKCCPGRGFQLLLRIQDNGNYMYVSFKCSQLTLTHYTHITWHKVVNGIDQIIPDTELEYGSLSDAFFKIELQDSMYTLSLNGKRQIYFADDTFASGGFQLTGESGMRIDSIEILRLP